LSQRKRPNVISACLFAATFAFPALVAGPLCRIGKVIGGS
jgi:hypothetical protein